MAPNRALLRQSIAILLAFGLIDVAASATSHKPRRAPVPHDIEPETTATIPAKTIPAKTIPAKTIPVKPAPRAPDAAAAAKADDEVLPAPFRLPAASHARMRDCGRKWQAMKMSGEAGDDIWRDFATRCLAAANGPFETR